MEDGDEAIVFFRGRLEGEYDFSEYFDVEMDGDREIVDTSTLKDMSEDELWELAEAIGCCGYTEDSDEDALRSAVERRVHKELEPIVQVKHYIARNKGKQGRDLFVNCANPDMAASALDWHFETDCRSCHERMNGDKGVSTMSPFTWTVYDTREVHRVPSKIAPPETKKKGREDKDSYVSCTMATKSRCRWCSHNKQIDSRDQDDIKRDDLKDLAKKGYCIKYRNELKMLELSESQYSLIEALEIEVRQNYCRSCGEKELEIAGANCPDCSESFDFDALMSTGWDPDKPNAMVVRCEACSASVKPECAYICNGCDDPVPARLGDVPVKVRMTKEGKNEKRVWTFKVAGNAQPFVLGESDERDRIIGSKLIDYDEVTKAPSIAEQVKQLGCAVDPITGEAVGASTSKAPTVNSASRANVSKGVKGGKVAKGGKTGGIKPGTSKTTKRTLGSRFTKRA